ncbi:hypothetical protein J0H58_02995 [bacterium]|nr:hypothetical protein [bacterium]
MTTQAERVGRAIGLAAGTLGLAVALAAAGLGAQAAQKEESAQKVAAQPAGEKSFTLEGASICQKCHNESDPTTVPEYKQTLGYEFIRLWENKIWGAYDLHSLAYKNLATTEWKNEADEVIARPNVTAVRMETNLRQALRQAGKDDKNYTVAADSRCLACHASAKVPPARALVETKWTAADDYNTDTKDGVGCEMCHGHGSAYRDPHQLSKLDKKSAPPGAIRSVAWREWDPVEKKSKEFGLVNLRDPAVATARCASCHVGNLDEGRFVTHEMYAAGHPPLPPLDLIAYTREQPRHWGLPSEMPYLTGLAKRDAEKAWKVFHYRAGESAVTRRFAESAVATLRANLDLTAQLAADATKTGGGLDFSAFDCYACHHDLKYPSDRQARGYLGPPGRPLFRPAPFALARVVADHAAGLKGGEALSGKAAALFEVEKELARAFGAKTFGDPALIQKAVAKGTGLTDETLAALQKLTYDPTARDGLLAAVEAAARQGADPKAMAVGRLPVADPEVAQLYAWAYETLALDRAGTVVDPKAGPPKPPADVEALHAKLKGFVVTRLRPGAVFYGEQQPKGGLPAPNLESVDRRLQQRMAVFNNFQADPFRRAFAEIGPPKK